MEIPAIFAQADRSGELRSIKVEEGRSIPSGEDTLTGFDEAASSLPQTESRDPVVVIDWGSICSRSFHEKVLKNMRVRGRDIWFMSWISDADDLMDAFNTTADTVISPLNAISDIEDLEDINTMSDSFIPAILCRNGGGMGIGSLPRGIRETLESLESLGFYRTCVVDTDGSVTSYEWERIGDIFPSTIPFVSRASDAPGFGTTIAPLRY